VEAVRLNKTKHLSDDSWVWLAIADLLLSLVFLLFFIVIAWFSVNTAHAEEKPVFAPNPPVITPYKIPTMRGKSIDYHHVPPIKIAPIIDVDALFLMIINCFPERPQWGIEVKAVTGARMTDGGVSTFDTAGLAKYYAGIVAEMPIYSTEEIHKQRTQEYQRRGEISANIAKLLKSLADRQRALRMLGINEAAEARSQLRMNEGLAPAEEQITYLKAVADKVGDLDEANAGVVSARLTLVGQCRDEVSENVNNYLKEITK
jgi:hypothetical protein